jgi:hypothetical protein
MIQHLPFVASYLPIDTYRHSFILDRKPYFVSSLDVCSDSKMTVSCHMSITLFVRQRQDQTASSQLVCYEWHVARQIFPSLPMLVPVDMIIHMLPLT